MTTLHNRQRWHSAIGATNLQDTPSLGPLTAEDLRPYQPAEAATDVGIEYDGSLSIASGIVLGVVAALAIWAAAVTLWLAI